MRSSECGRVSFRVQEKMQDIETKKEEEEEEEKHRYAYQHHHNYEKY